MFDVSYDVRIIYCINPGLAKRLNF